MNTKLDFQFNDTEPRALPLQVLYIGKSATEIAGALLPLTKPYCAHYLREVGEALGLARKAAFDVIIVDQRDHSLVRKLIIPLVISMERKVKLIVISAADDVGEYLQIQGVSRVLQAPVQSPQLLRILDGTAALAQKRLDVVQRAFIEEIEDRNFNPERQIQTPQHRAMAQPRLRPVLRRINRKTPKILANKVVFGVVCAILMAMVFVGTFAIITHGTLPWSGPLVAQKTAENIQIYGQVLVQSFAKWLQTLSS